MSDNEADARELAVRIAELELRYSAERERNAQLQTRLHEAGEAYRRLDRGVAQLELTVLNHQDALERTAAELASVQASRSWRLTAPLRAVIGLLRARRGPR